MKDEFSIFINDSVYYTQTEYYKLINKTKELFFYYLQKQKSDSYFKKEANKIWGNIDHSYMEQRIQELEKMISAKNLEGRKILNPNAEFEQIFPLDSESKYINIEKK